MIRSLRFVLVILTASVVAPPAALAAEGTMKWGVHVSLTPAFFDPADATGTALPLMVWYAVHDALVRPLPGSRMGAAPAQSWSQSADGLSYEFVLRKGVKFQNGDPITAEDVKFSFERYRGATAAPARPCSKRRWRPSRSWIRFACAPASSSPGPIS